MAKFTRIEGESIQVGTAAAPPFSTVDIWQSLDPTVPFSLQNWGISNFQGLHNQIGLYNGIGNWSQIGLGNLIGFGADVGGHVDAQPSYTSAGVKIDLSSPLGDLNQFWRYNGVEITNESTDSTSDVRLKTDIRPYENCLDKILNLNPVYYKWRDDIDKSSFTGKDKDDVQIGLIAQEVEPFIPEVVVNHSIYDEEYKRIKYSKLTAVLVGAIKEQQEQINSLKQTVEELSTKLAECCS